MGFAVAVTVPSHAAGHARMMRSAQTGGPLWLLLSFLVPVQRFGRNTGTAGRRILRHCTRCICKRPAWHEGGRINSGHQAPSEIWAAFFLGAEPLSTALIDIFILSKIGISERS